MDEFQCTVLLLLFWKSWSDCFLGLWRNWRSIVHLRRCILYRVTFVFLRWIFWWVNLVLRSICWLGTSCLVVLRVWSLGIVFFVCCVWVRIVLSERYFFENEGVYICHHKSLVKNLLIFLVCFENKFDNFGAVGINSIEGFCYLSRSDFWVSASEDLLNNWCSLLFLVGTCWIQRQSNDNLLILLLLWFLLRFYLWLELWLYFRLGWWFGLCFCLRLNCGFDLGLNCRFWLGLWFRFRNLGAFVVFQLKSNVTYWTVKSIRILLAIGNVINTISSIDMHFIWTSYTVISVEFQTALRVRKRKQKANY